MNGFGATDRRYKWRVKYAYQCRRVALISRALDNANRAAAAVASGLNDTPIRVAVTGLSRAGKTVFLTSLITNFLALKGGKATLPAIQAALDKGGMGRLRHVRLLPAGAGTTPRFDYEAKLLDLAAERPAWPARTEDLAEIALELEVRPPGGFLGTMRGMVGNPRIKLELLDYPGEWLLDLPMLPKSYSDWSRETLALLRQAPRLALAQPFLERMTQIDIMKPADDALIRPVHELYKATMERCRKELGLRYLQPGRFICMGPRNDAPFMWFFPVDNVPDRSPHASMVERLTERYEAYKADVKANFISNHFSRFDRQVVLVDVLGALSAGKAAYEDTERAIADIAKCLAGEGNLLGRLFRQQTPKRVAFVATKADHVPELQRDNLRSLLRAMSQSARGHGPVNSDAVSYHVAASVLSTRDGWIDHDDRPREAVVWGRRLGDTKDRAYQTGSIPIGHPPEGFWSGRYFELPIFTPPPIDESGIFGIRQLGIDGVIAELIGDQI